MKNINQSFIRVIIAGFCFICILGTCVQYNKTNLAEQNILALTDSLVYFKNKAKEEVATKNSLLMDYDQLKQINSELAGEIGKLSRKDRKNLLDITKLSLEINNLQDSIKTLNTLYSGVTTVNDTTNVYKFTFGESTKFRKLSGEVNVSAKSKPYNVQTNILEDKIFADIVLGKKEVRDGVQIFASSSNPSVKVTGINGTIIKNTVVYKKAKPFSFGLSVGYGASKSGLSPYVGVGINYKIFNF